MADVPYIDEKLQERKDSVTPNIRKPVTGSRTASAGKAAVTARKTAPTAAGENVERDEGIKKRPTSAASTSKPGVKPTHNPHVTSPRANKTDISKTTSTQRPSISTSKATSTTTPTASKAKAASVKTKSILIFI